MAPERGQCPDRQPPKRKLRSGVRWGKDIASPTVAPGRVSYPPTHNDHLDRWPPATATNRQKPWGLVLLLALVGVSTPAQCSSSSANLSSRAWKRGWSRSIGSGEPIRASQFLSFGVPYLTVTLETQPPEHVM